MINKEVASVAEALQGIKDGSTVLIGGFGPVGQPDILIDALVETGVRDLTIVANNAGRGRESGISLMMARGLVRKIVCSFPKASVVLDELYRAGKIEFELVPQGNLAERIRCAGAGIPGFYTATGVGTPLAEGKEVREFGGKTYLLEEAIHGDVALIEAWAADRWGNLTYRGSGRNFNPVMATAAPLTIAQVHKVVPLGTIDPDLVVTPGIFVNRFVNIEQGA